MKPNSRQIAIIDAVIQQLQFFKSSNDIDSPSHSSDIFEFGPEGEAEDDVRSTLHIMWHDIRNLSDAETSPKCDKGKISDHE